jgi:hypothetical protein
MMNMKLLGRGEMEGPQMEDRLVMFWMPGMSHRLLYTGPPFTNQPLTSK